MSFWAAEALGPRAPTLDPRAPTTVTKRRWMWSSVAAAERNAAEPQDPGVLLGPSPFWCSCWAAGDLSKPTPSHAEEQPMVNPTPTPSHGAAATQGQTTAAAAVNFQILAEGMDGRRKTTRGYRFKKFSLEDRNGGNGDPEAIEISVHDYFVNYHAAGLTYSGDLPCINVGKPKRPAYLPIELCQLPLQRYTKSLSTLQRSSLVEKLRQKPQERMSVLSDVRKRSNYDTEPMLKASGISIAQGFTQVAGRVLQAPKVNDYIVKEAHRLHQIELREKEHLKFLRLLLKDFMIKSGI